MSRQIVNVRTILLLDVLRLSYRIRRHAKGNQEYSRFLMLGIT